MRKHFIFIASMIWAAGEIAVSNSAQAAPGELDASAPIIVRDSSSGPGHSPHRNVVTLYRKSGNLYVSSNKRIPIEQVNRLRLTILKSRPIGTKSPLQPAITEEDIVKNMGKILHSATSRITPT